MNAVHAERPHSGEVHAPGPEVRPRSTPLLVVWTRSTGEPRAFEKPKGSVTKFFEEAEQFPPSCPLEVFGPDGGLHRLDARR